MDEEEYDYDPDEDEYDEYDEDVEPEDEVSVPIMLSSDTAIAAINELRVSYVSSNMVMSEAPVEPGAVPISDSFLPQQPGVIGPHPHDHNIGEGNQSFSVRMAGPGYYETPWGTWSAVSYHDPNQCLACHESVRLQHQHWTEQRNAVKRQNLPCTFYQPAIGSEEPDNPEWPWDRRVAFPACSNPLVTGVPNGIGQCRYHAAKGACGARKDPEAAQEMKKFIPLLVS